jgi:hypothetical protein
MLQHNHMSAFQCHNASFHVVHGDGDVFATGRECHMLHGQRGSKHERRTVQRFRIQNVDGSVVGGRHNFVAVFGTGDRRDGIGVDVCVTLIAGGRKTSNIAFGTTGEHVTVRRSKHITCPTDMSERCQRRQIA